MGAGPTGDTVKDEAVPENEDLSKYIILSDGQRLMKPPPILKTGWKPKCVALIVTFRLNLVDRVQALIAKYLGDKHVHIFQARLAIHGEAVCQVILLFHGEDAFQARLAVHDGSLLILYCMLSNSSHLAMLGL